MPGLEPGIHVFHPVRFEDVGGRDEPGHDGEGVRTVVLRYVPPTAVMPGPAPGIHVFRRLRFQDVGGRDKPGHDA
jgi:hypothetical protein